MARPSKAAENLKRHTTKAELEQRKAAQESSFTGLPVREAPDVANDPVAHQEFVRVTELLASVGRNDAMFEAVINDYCVLKSDLARYTDLRRTIQEDGEISGTDRYKLILNCDKQIDSYRKKRFDIEKENGFTMASALRAIPKKVETPQNPLIGVLNNGGGG